MINNVPQKVLIAQAIWDLPTPDERRAAIVQYLQKSYPNYKPIRTKQPFVMCEVARKQGNYEG